MKKKSILLAIVLSFAVLIGACSNNDTKATDKETESAAEETELITSEETEVASAITEESKSEEIAKEPIRLFLVRHGQTYSNIKEATIGGGGNAQLTEKGRQYAYSLGLGFNAEDIKFTAAYSSTLGRAYETASQILRGNGQELPITQYDDIKDISWGSVEGGRIADLEGQFGHDGNDFVAYFGTYDQEDFISPVPGAESTHDFSERIDAGLRKIVAENESTGGNILVVGHSSLGFYLHKYRADNPMAGLTNTSTSVLEYVDGEFTLLDYDNVEYLENGIAIKDALQPLQIKLVTTPQTIFKTADVLEGTSDSDLNDAGVAQAEALKAIMESTGVDVVYTSTLNRSRNSAGIALDGTNLEPIENTYLDELFLGYWEAENLNVLKDTDTSNLDKLLSNDQILSFSAPDGGGEIPLIAAYRLDSALQDIAVENQALEGTVYVFTHPFIVATYLNQYFPEYTFETSDNMQIVTLEYASEIFTVSNIEVVTAE